MKVKQLEKNLTLALSDVRKGYYGKGAIDTQVRVCGDTIFVKYRSIYSPLEKMLISKMMNSADLKDVYREVEALTLEGLKQKLAPVIGNDIEVLSVTIMPDAGNDTSYHCILLDKNIERITRSSKD